VACAWRRAADIKAEKERQKAFTKEKRKNNISGRKLGKLNDINGGCKRTKKEVPDVEGMATGERARGTKKDQRRLRKKEKKKGGVGNIERSDADCSQARADGSPWHEQIR